MHSTWQRLSNTFALATSVILALVAAISATTFLLPANLDPASLAVSHLNVVLGRPQYERYAKEREYAFVKFDLQADLSPLFHWNTKQLFVYLVADYHSDPYPANSVVVWDRIVRSPRHAKLNVQDGKQKYEFKEITNSFRNTSATFSLHYQVQPYVGALTGGEVVRTEPVAFPPVRTRSQ
ncbi:signal peptidase complex subunit SPC3 [Rhodotorula paludigena]|uniref:signal peptidase complex subunit SPC3 n=1 Tax=Rhodotorula paludigena TaxID=86838 RepID=UPI003172ABFE